MEIKHSLEGSYGGMTEKEIEELDRILGGFIKWLREMADPDDYDKIEEDMIKIIKGAADDRDRNMKLRKLASEYSAKYRELGDKYKPQEYKRLTYKAGDKIGIGFLRNISNVIKKKK